MFFVNKMDNENADFYKVFEELKTKFGPMVCPLVVPYVEDHQVKCYINLLEYKAYTYQNGKAAPVPLPDMGHRLDGLRTAINEAVAETSEELMDKYFSGEDFTYAEMIQGLRQGVKDLSLFPVVCGSAVSGLGTRMLLDIIVELLPSPLEGRPLMGENADGDFRIEADVNLDATQEEGEVIFKNYRVGFVEDLAE